MSSMHVSINAYSLVLLRTLVEHAWCYCAPSPYAASIVSMHVNSASACITYSVSLRTWSTGWPCSPFAGSPTLLTISPHAASIVSMHVNTASACITDSVSLRTWSAGWPCSPFAGSPTLLTISPHAASMVTKIRRPQRLFRNQLQTMMPLPQQEVRAHDPQQTSQGMR